MPQPQIIKLAADRLISIFRALKIRLTSTRRAFPRSSKEKPALFYLPDQIPDCLYKQEIRTISYSEDKVRISFFWSEWRESKTRLAALSVHIKALYQADFSGFAHFLSRSISALSRDSRKWAFKRAAASSRIALPEFSIDIFGDPDIRMPHQGLSSQRRHAARNSVYAYSWPQLMRGVTSARRWLWRLPFQAPPSVTVVSPAGSRRSSQSFVNRLEVSGSAPPKIKSAGR